MRVYLDGFDKIALAFLVLTELIVLVMFVLFGMWQCLAVGLWWGYEIAVNYPFVFLHSYPASTRTIIMTSVPPQHHKLPRDPASGRFVKKRPF